MSSTYHKSFTLTNSSAQLDLGLNGSETLQISSVSFVNTSNAAVTANMNIAGDGGAAATGNTLEINKPLAAYQTAGSALTGGSVNPGGKVYGYASTTGVVVVHIFGIVSAQAARTW